MSADPQKVIDSDMERVREACRLLIEHFEGVQIFCSRHESGELDGTINCQYGLGNWYARYGQVSAWLVKQDEEFRMEIRKDQNP